MLKLTASVFDVSSKGENKMKNYAIIIPALNPTERLIDYVNTLNTLIVEGAKQVIE